MTKTTLRVIHHVTEKRGGGKPFGEAHTPHPLLRPSINFPAGPHSERALPLRIATSAWAEPAFQAETPTCALMNSALGLGPLRCFRRRTCPQAFTHAVHRQRFGETLIIRAAASQCCSTLLRTGKRAAFQIIAQSISRWHRRRARAVSRPARVSGQACGRREVWAGVS